MKRIVLLLLVCMSNGWLFANHWTPNDSSYEDNMTLTGVIQINGVEQQSTTLEVGVFCEEECRGSGYAACFAPTQHYLVQLLIFGEAGDQLTFKLYDSDSGQELDLTSPDAVTFVANGYGSLFNPYVLNFKGSGTHWIPNESSYENNMTLTGVIQINGVEQQSITLEVGVFCGTECRGTGLATYFQPTQHYVVQLLIFGESGNRFTFKLYDHALGQELNLTSPSSVTFRTNGYGSLSNPYVLNFTGSIPESYVVSASANPVEGGTIEGAGTYLGGQTCTLTATANEGYAFTNWTENGTVVSTTPTFTFSVTSNRTLVANFTNMGSNHWIPDQSSYEDNMTLTGVIQINGVEQQSATLEVGVFCGEECRGSGLATYFFPTQRYVVQLLIFGEAGDQLTFKLYDHAIGQELNLTSPDAVTFVTNGYGSLGDPYVLNFTGEASGVTQTIALVEGTNWFSTYVDITLADLKAALVASFGTNATITIKAKDKNTKYQRGRWAGSLTEADWNLAKMYQIIVTSDGEITLVGTPIDPTTLTLNIVEGTNWIAYPYAESTTVANFFAGFAINNDQVKSKDKNVKYRNGRWTGQLTSLEPGKGYWYISVDANNRIFTFPSGAK